MSDNTSDADKVHKAAEMHPDNAKSTNPVGEATQGVNQAHKDPYADGKHIDNPEPNNGNGADNRDKDPTERDPKDAKADRRSQKLQKDQEERDAKANTPDANLPDEDKTNTGTKDGTGSQSDTDAR